MKIMTITTICGGCYITEYQIVVTLLFFISNKVLLY